MDIQIVNGTAEASGADLVVMMKAPANAKRRLAAEIGELAGEAAARLLACALEDARAWPGSTWLSPANQCDLDWLLSEVDAQSMPTGTYRLPAAGTASQPDSRNEQRGGICGLVPQQGANLGARINYVDSYLRRRGADKLLFVGTDCPGLDSAYLEQAAFSLQNADAVLGPAGDGGVVLMGARLPWPDLRGLGWSTQGLGVELRGLCREAGWSVATLDVRDDVDTVADLLGAGDLLSEDGRASRRCLSQWVSAHCVPLWERQPGGVDEAPREPAP